MATACQSKMKEMAKTSDDIKAAALSSTATAVSSTSLQDLPIEMLDDILMKAVIKKVMVKKLAKSAWIDYSSRVVMQLRTVSLQWDYSLTTNWFEIVLYRKLNNCKDPTAVSVELITTSECDTCCWRFARLNNHIYCIDTYPPEKPSQDCDDSILYVFKGQDTTHRIKEILLPSVKCVGGMATCKRSNSIYVWESGPTSWRHGAAVWHLVPDGDGGFEVLQWPTYAPSGDSLDCSTISEIAVDDLSVLDDGNILVFLRVFCEGKELDNIVSVHKPDGLVIRKVTLSLDADLPNAAMKSNGNFVYSQLINHGNSGGCIFREVDEDGKEIHNFLWSHECCLNNCRQLFLDAYDRVIFHDGYNGLIILDSELNFLGEAKPVETNDYFEPLHTEFDKETNEMIVVSLDKYVYFLNLTV